MGKGTLCFGDYIEVDCISWGMASATLVIKGSLLLLILTGQMVARNRALPNLEIPSVRNSTAVVLKVCREAPGGRRLMCCPGSWEFIAQDSQDVAELSVIIFQSGSREV